MKSNSRVLRGWRDFGVKATAIILTILLATQMVGTPAFASGALTNKQASEDIATTVDDTGVEPSGTEATDTTVPDEAAGAANEPAPADSTQATEEPVVETVESATEPATETPAADPAANTVLGTEPEPTADSGSEPAPAVEQNQLAPIKLILADGTSITYDGNAIDNDTNPIEVPANEEFKFAAQAADGWQIDAVKTVVDGVETELVADANGEYSVAAEDVANALTVMVEGSEVVEADEVIAENEVAATVLNAPIALAENATLKLDSSSTVIAVDGTHTFTASLVSGEGVPTELDGSDCTWNTSDEAVATVVNGVVTGVAAGTAKITCTYNGLQVSAMVTVTNANYRLVYESNYPANAKKYVYQNGNTASVDDAVNTTVNETFEPGETATVEDGIFTTINYDLVSYLGSDGKTYKVGDTIRMNANITLTAQWKPNGNSTATESIKVRYYKISNSRMYVDKDVNATVSGSGDSRTVTFVVGNNQDTIIENYDDFYGWRIGEEEYSFNEQVTTTAKWVSTGWWGGYWRVEATPLRAELNEDEACAQFFIRKADATGFGVADQYYSVGAGTINISTFKKRRGGKCGIRNRGGNGQCR